MLDQNIAKRSTAMRKTTRSARADQYRPSSLSKWILTHVSVLPVTRCIDVPRSEHTTERRRPRAHPLGTEEMKVYTAAFEHFQRDQKAFRMPLLQFLPSMGPGTSKCEHGRTARDVSTCACPLKPSMRSPADAECACLRADKWVQTV